MRPRSGLSIRALLLGAHAFVWLLPLLAFSVLRVYDVYLLRQTEHQLIAESVVVGELFRAAWLRSQDRTHDDHRPAHDGYRAARAAEPYLPIAARVDFGFPVGEREPLSYPSRPNLDDDAARAGREIEPLLRRAQTFNLSALRVLDARGCVVATTRSQAGLCLTALPEVQSALRGRYDVALRERISDEPLPRFGDVRRRGEVRVFTALPVWSDGRVIAVVRASRTGLDALSSLWANRRGLLWSALAALLIVIAVSATFSAAIARPLERLTAAARRVAAGQSADALTRTGRVPREIGVLHEVLFQMARKLELRANYVQDFASELSHELKTPITAIRGAAELLQQGLDDMPQADRKRFTENIVEDAQRMERLVARLLELARVENRRPEAPPAIDVVARAQKLLERYGPRVVCTVEAAPSSVRIAPEELDSVLTNLVENALRHGAPHEVQVALRGEGSRLWIDVSDRGPGVSEANRRRLFERFFTTERDHGGTGLGLAIVKAIADARGGRVVAHFDARGTTFSVLL